MLLVYYKSKKKKKVIASLKRAVPEITLCRREPLIYDMKNICNFHLRGDEMQNLG